MDQSTIAFVARRHWPFQAMIVIGLIWLVVAALADPISGFIGPLATLPALLSRIFPPAMALLLVAAFLPVARRPQDVEAMESRLDAAASSAGLLEEQLGRIYSTLIDCSDRVQILQQQASTQGDGLAASARSLETSATRLADSSGELGKSAGDLLDIIPGLISQALEARDMLSGGQTEISAALDAASDMLANVRSQNSDLGADSRKLITDMQTMLQQIDETSSETTRTIASRAYALDAAVSGVLERANDSFDQIGQKLETHGSNVQAMLSAGQEQLDQYGNEGTRLIGQRLDVLLAAASKLKQHFHDHEQMSAALDQQGQQTLALTEERLGHLLAQQKEATESIAQSAEQQMALLDRQLDGAIRKQRQAESEQAEELAATIKAAEDRMQQLRQQQQDSLNNLSELMSDMVSATADKLSTLGAHQSDIHAQLSAEAATLTDNIRQLFEQMGTNGQQMLQTSGQTAADVATELERMQSALGKQQDMLSGLNDRMARLIPDFDEFAAHLDARLPMLGNSFDLLTHRGQTMTEELDELGSRIQSQIELLRDSASAFERDHAAVADLAQSLAGEFQSARNIITEIDSHVEKTALASATRMVENVMQVRETVHNTSSEIQRLLKSVVGEAEAALDNLAHSRAEEAFGAPIRLQIAALEDASVRAADAASVAAERLSSQLVSLLQTVARTEARIDEVDTRMDVRARETLAARSLRLVDSLQAASIDITRLLAVDVGDEAWARYLNGDRSLFARKIVRLGDRDTRRKLQRHFNHDAEFQQEAARYLEQFEELIRRVLKDPDGESFALVLLSSDIGKLYVLISQAIGRNIIQSAA